MLEIETASYSNPIYNQGFPDPYVLKFCGQYWAYCTGFWTDGGCFGILHSRDLVNWQVVGSALQPLPGGHTDYWAPEVFYFNGRFYLYYSVGNEEFMHIRVATADHPGGPFEDCGRRLTGQDFAIDAHVFTDDDDRNYLFYATDFLQHTHIGTGTVVDRLEDMYTPAGRPRPVTRARYDWQVYDPQRASKGGVRWHTIEGPFVLKRKGRYYQMFSGGNWQNISYGVSYAVSDSLLSSEEWRQVADGRQVLPVLRTIPDSVIGPGHNSVVRGPNNRQLYCVYHRWASDNSARQLAIDPLDWAGERMLILGPSTTPRPVPLRPSISGFINPDGAHGWQYSPEHWHPDEDGTTLVRPASGSGGPAVLNLATPYCLVELSLRAAGPTGEAGSYGVSLAGPANDRLNVRLVPARNRLEVVAGDDAPTAETALPAGFNPQVYHLLRLEVEGRRVKIWLDNLNRLLHDVRLDFEPQRLELDAGWAGAAFAGFELTNGWEDLFMEDDHPQPAGWRSQAGISAWFIQANQLCCRAEQRPEVAVKGPLLDSYELVVNARLDRLAEGGGYGFYPAFQAGQAGPGPLVRLEKREQGWNMRVEHGAAFHHYELPAGFDPYSYQQFYFRKKKNQLYIAWERLELGELELDQARSGVALYAHQATVAFDMVRMTELS